MTWTDKVGNLLKQYTGGGAAAAAQPAPDVHAHFDEVARAAPPSALLKGSRPHSILTRRQPLEKRLQRCLTTQAAIKRRA